jgi:hypothetical protein
VRQKRAGKLEKWGNAMPTVAPSGPAFGKIERSLNRQQAYIF